MILITKKKDEKETAENKIAKEFFLDFTTGASVSRKLYPQEIKPQSSITLNKRKNVGIVGLCLSKWKKAGYIDEKKELILKKNFKGKEYSQKIPVYNLNLKFFFDFAKEGKVKFSKEEKNYIYYIINKSRDFILNNYPINNLTEKIKYFLLDFCVISETKFYYEFFNETLNNYGKLFHELLNKKYKEMNDFFVMELGEWRVYGLDEKETIMKKEIGEKVLLLFGFNKNLIKKFSGYF